MVADAVPGFLASAGMRTELEIAVPPGWEVARDVAPDVPLVLAARAAPDLDVIPTVAVSVTPTELCLADHQTGLRAELTARLEAAEVDDPDLYDIGDEEVSYLRVWHRCEDADVVSEVWSWVVDGLAWSVTASVGAPDYPDYCDLFEAVAATFRPISPAA